MLEKTISKEEVILTNVLLVGCGGFVGAALRYLAAVSYTHLDVYKRQR